MKYSIIIPTKGRPLEAARVLKGLAATIGPVRPDVEIVLAVTGLMDVPLQSGLLKFWTVLEKEPGAARAIWTAVQETKSEWFIWLCDDVGFPDPGWFVKLLAFRESNPRAKAIALESGTGHHECAPIGAAEVKWFKGHYPEPVYSHYGWDNEIQEIAEEEGVFCPAYHILVQEKPNHAPDPERKAAGWKLWQERKQQRQQKGTK